jgi:hypothetical protein
MVATPNERKLVKLRAKLLQIYSPHKNMIAHNQVEGEICLIIILLGTSKRIYLESVVNPKRHVARQFNIRYD